MAAWLRKRPREVSVAFTARAALRVLPVVQLEKRETYIRNLVLPVFRATAISWAAAKYPAREKELATACRVAAAALVAQSIGDTWGSGYAIAASRAAEYAAVVTIRDTASADSANAATDAVDALAAFGAGVGHGFNLDDTAFGANPVVDAFWSAVSIDATQAEEGVAASVIAGSPLWPLHPLGPEPLASLWQDMKAALLAAKQGWEVWTLWYDDRLAGRITNEEHELAYVRIEEALWDQGPAIVNAEIKRRIEALEPPQHVGQIHASSVAHGSSRASMTVTKHTPPRRRQKEPKPSHIPEIPSQRPAALEPVWSNGKLVLPSDPASTDGDPDALVAALKVLRAEIAELADNADGEANIDKRSIIYLRRKAEGIPEHAPAQDELFRLAHAKEFLEGYATTVNKEWPDFLAQRFHALTLHFDRTVRQFPRWRAFVRNANKDRLTSERAAEVPAIAEVTVEILRDEDALEFADAAIPNALESLNAPLAPSIADDGQPLDPIEAGYALLAEDVLESINNILKATAEGLLVCATSSKAAAKAIGATAKETAAGFASEARKSIVDEGKRLGKGTGPALTKWGKRILFSGATAAAPSFARLLIHAFPEKFGWLQPVMDFFSSVIR
ncbi:MAG: hypothetical protein WBZ54_11760 [Methylocella sp.]